MKCAFSQDPGLILCAGNVLVHRDNKVATVGAGLFVNGGNPVYYTSKGNAQDVANQVQAVLRGNLNDLGGHHIVLKVVFEAWSGMHYMRVDKAPLVSANGISRLRPMQDDIGIDPAYRIFENSKESTWTTWGDLDGWLYNLAGK